MVFTESKFYPVKMEAYITRKCQLNCSYCQIYRKRKWPNELDVDEWKEVIKFCHDKLGVGMSILYGGEPLTLGQGLVDLVRWLGKNPQYAYAVISNSVGYEAYREDLLSAGLRNWSASCDSLDYIRNADKFTLAKSSKGYQAMKWFTEHGVKDCVANTVIHRMNYKQLPALVEKLNSEGIWSIHTMLHWKRSEINDFCSWRSGMEDLCFKQEDAPLLNEIAQQLKAQQLKGYKIHYVPEYFDLMSTYGINLDWHCSEPGILKIDADGKMRVCTDVRGVRTKNHSIWDLESSAGKEAFLKDWWHDSRQCKGCFWAAHWSAEFMSQRYGYEINKSLQRHDITADTVYGHSISSLYSGGEVSGM